jgi:hypothetical protein
LSCVHDIREVKDPRAPIHPLRLPETCARCHGDAKHMAPYKLNTDQFAEYRSSVHWEALAKRGDLSALFASCHGNHGATPPQVSSVSAVRHLSRAAGEPLPEEPARAGVHRGGLRRLRGLPQQPRDPQADHRHAGGASSVHQCTNPIRRAAKPPTRWRP